LTLRGFRVRTPSQRSIARNPGICIAERIVSPRPRRSSSAAQIRCPWHR
jgi:hypothetical protein